MLNRVIENLVGRTEGPMKLRLVLQPLMAIIFAARSGMKDGREGRPPFFWALLSDADQRKQLLKQAWKDVSKIFIAAVVMDCVYQFIAIKTLHPGEAILVGFILAFVPYVLVRGLLGRLTRRRT
ncbi:MAG: hypothetical protein ACRENS_10365 [Candidatus Eiseniibacteriota bacterium]